MRKEGDLFEGYYRRFTDKGDAYKVQGFGRYTEALHFAAESLRSFLSEENDFISQL